MRGRGVAAAAVGVAIVAAVWLRREDRPATYPSTTSGEQPAAHVEPAAATPAGQAHSVAVAPPPPAASSPSGAATADAHDDADTLEAVRAAIATKTEASTAALVRALDGHDSIAKIEAIDELVRRKHVGAIAPLLEIDPADDPIAGPTALLGLGNLAREAEEPSREAAVARLSKLLESEKARRGTDSPGNILLIFEALGNVRSASAARVLERELLSPSNDTTGRVGIVNALEACGQTSSLPVLRAFRADFRASAADAFERELEQDLLRALERAIEALGR